MIKKRDVIVGENLNDLVYSTFNYVLEKGNSIPSRNGSCLEVVNAELELSNPTKRHLYLAGRKSNIYATICEALWVLSGSDKLDPLMNFVLPRAKDYSDDGLTWRGAYSSRIFKNNQLNHIIEMFKQDGLDTRRATMAIWRPDLDTHEVIQSQGIEKTKDMCCSQHLSFWIRDGELNMKLLIRSNDGVYGLSAINVFEFTMIQELVLRLLQNTIPEAKHIEIGTYYHNAISLHLYDPGTADQARAVISKENSKENKKNCSIKQSDFIELGDIQYPEFLTFFREIYDHLCLTLINSKSTNSISSIFNKYNIPINSNALFQYAYLAENYLISKKDTDDNRDFNPKEMLSPDLLEAVKFSSFTPKTWSL